VEVIMNIFIRSSPDPSLEKSKQRSGW